MRLKQTFWAVERINYNANTWIITDTVRFTRKAAKAAYLIGLNEMSVDLRMSNYGKTWRLVKVKIEVVE